MVLSKRTIIVAVVCSVVLFLAGYFSWVSLFFDFILPVKPGVSYVSTSVIDMFYPSIIFALSLALIPLTTILIWRFAPVVTQQRRILTVCIIILAMVGSVWIRREMIWRQVNTLSPVVTLDYSDPANPVQKEIQMGLRFSDLKFEKFAFIGLVAGSLVSFFALRGDYIPVRPNSE